MRGVPAGDRRRGVTGGGVAPPAESVVMETTPGGVSRGRRLGVTGGDGGASPNASAGPPRTRCASGAGIPAASETRSVTARARTGSTSSSRGAPASSTTECAERGGSIAVTAARAPSESAPRTTPLHTQPTARAGSISVSLPARIRSASSEANSPPPIVAVAQRARVQRISAEGRPPGCERCRRRSGGITDSKTSGCAVNSMPRSENCASNSSGVRRASIESSAAAGQRPTYVIRSSPLECRRTYRAAATGGATSETRCGASSEPDASTRRATCGHEQWIAGRAPPCESTASVALATSSSPQLAGIAASNPAARHACASWTGVAGRAASCASLPRITTAGACEARISATGVNVDTRESASDRGTPQGS